MDKIVFKQRMIEELEAHFEKVDSDIGCGVMYIRIWENGKVISDVKFPLESIDDFSEEKIKKSIPGIVGNTNRKIKYTRGLIE